MQPRTVNDQPVVLAGMAAAPVLAGLFAVSFEGLILTNAHGQCLQLNPVALEILGLEAVPPHLYLADFLEFRTDPAWETWQNAHPPANGHAPEPAFRSQTQLRNHQGQTATISYAVISQAKDLLLWIVPPPQLIQWQSPEPISPKLTEATYQAILETQTEMVVRFLPDSTFTYVNPAYCEMIGRKPEELLGRRFFEVIPPDAQAMMQEELQVMNSLTPRHPQWVVINPSLGHDGSQVWHEWTNIALFNEAGEIIEFQATGRDITADYNFTRTLKAAKDRLQLAFEIADMGYCDWDLRSNRLLLSESYERLLGLAPGSFDQRIETFSSLVHPEDRARVEAITDHIISSRQRDTFEFRIIQPSGEIRWFLACCTALYDDQGYPVRFTGVDLDITERKLREQELEYQRDLRELLFNESTDAMFLVDPKTVQIVDCNPRSVELFEADSKAELLGLVGHEDLHVAPLTPAELAENIEQMHRQGFWSMQVEYQTRKGNRFWGNIATKPVEIAGQAFTFVRITDVTQWKQAEFQLAASELRYRTIFDQASLGIAFCEAPNYRLTETNPYLQELLGYGADELRGLDYRDFTHPDDIAPEQVFIEECFAGQRDAYQIEKRYICKDGSICWVNLLSTIIRAADGSIPYAFALIKDITSRKEAEAQLQASEARFRSIFEQAAFGIAYGSITGEFIKVNQAFTDITGYTEAELKQRSFLNITYPPDLEAEQPLIEALMREDIPAYTIEKRYIRKDGSLVWVSLSVNKIYDEAGNVIGGMGIVQDISQRKALETELETARLKYQALFETLPIGLNITDHTGQLIEVNPASETILGIPIAIQTSKVYTSSIWQCFYPDGRPMPPEELPATLALQRGEVITNAEMVVLRPDASKVCLSVTAAPLPNPELGVAIAFFDITEMKRVEQELAAARLKYQTLFEIMPLGILITDDQGKIIDVNPASDAISGLPSEHPKNRQFDDPAWECYSSEGRRLLPEDYPASIALRENRVIHGIEIGYKHPDGHLIWLEITAAPIPIPGLGVVLTYQDITERKAAEQALREKDAMLNLALDAGKQGIFEVDLISGEVQVSSRYWEMLGYGKDEIQMSTTQWGNWLHPEEHTAVYQAFTDLANGITNLFETEYRQRTKQGDWVWFYSTGIVVAWDETGKPTRMLGVYNNINDRKLAAQALQDQETTLRLALEAGNQGVWEIDLTTGTGKIDAGYAVMLGYEPGELVQTIETWENSLHPDERPSVSEQLRAYISGQTDGYHTEFRMRTKSGAYKWILSTGKIVAWDHRGQPTRILGTHTDIDQRKRAELALAKKASQEQLFAEISNDIRRSLDLREILDSAVGNIRRILCADRVLILRVLPNHHAETLAESVIPGLVSFHHRCWLDFSIPVICVQEYFFGDFHFVDQASHSRCNDCWIPSLTDNDIQSKIVAPINQTNEQGSYIWGILLIQSQHATPPWQPDDGALTAKICQQLAIAIQQAELYESLQAANQELEYLARYDGLTQVANRRHFDEHLQREWSRMEREQQPLAIIMCDIDFFKAYNDHYGHIAGDTCLRAVAQALQQTINRAGDLVARYGGEEFALILPNTSLAGALVIADKIQHAINKLDLPHHQSTIAQTVTLSLGITTQIPRPGSCSQTLVAQADNALYAAKQTGRNRYCYCPQP